MKRIIFTMFFLMVGILLKAQVLSVRVVDASTDNPIVNAYVMIDKTSVSGYTNQEGKLEFSLDKLTIAANELGFPKMDFQGTTLTFGHEIKSRLTIYSVLGQKVYDQTLPVHRINFSAFSSAIYLVNIDHEGIIYRSKWVCSENVLRGNRQLILQNRTFPVIVEKDGYQTYQTELKIDSENTLKLISSVAINEDYLSTIDNQEQFKSIEGEPLNPYFGEVTSVKFLYEIKTGRIYYINNNLHRAHFYFAESVLNYPKDNYSFNREQYQNNPNRLYYLGTIDYFNYSNNYVLQFISLDDISCDAINDLYRKIKSTCYFSEQLCFYANTNRTRECLNMKTISSDELLNGQNYQCLNPEETYGYLRKIDLVLVSVSELGKHDLALLNGIPVDVPVVAGIITTEFQTPLSHINVLSINRKTPNMVLRDGWTNTDLLQFENKLVYLKTGYENFEIREATLEEAQHFWDSSEPRSPVVLKPDTVTSGLIDLADLSVNTINVAGAKASNFGEMARISDSSGEIPLPEGAFAIPFYYYCQHMKSNGLDKLLNEMLTDESFKNDLNVRIAKLKLLQDKIKGAPVDPALISMVEQQIALNKYPNTRFRSSTNAEDIDGFNGAGLYDSETGTPGDKKNSVEKAIKKVWASLWNFKAYEEREYFKIDQRSVAMGILAHRSFPAEEANGVLITKNIYRDGLPAFTINCQFNEISIVNPEGGWLPEQILYYTFSEAENNPINYISYSNVPGYEGQRVLTDEELNLLYHHCQAIVWHYQQLGIYLPFDIEFKINKDEQGNRKLYIKQCRVFNG
jgi:pyruvate, water dikinase